MHKQVFIHIIFIQMTLEERINKMILELIYDIGDCSAKALNSLIYLCSKQKWYDKELEVIGLYIEEFMQCNEFLAEVYIEMYSEFEEAAFNALETNTPIDEVNEYGSPPLE